jgi:hypothetical protein
LNFEEAIMPRIGALFLMLALALCSVRYSPAQNTHIPIPPAVPQAQDLHVGVHPTMANGPAPPDDVQRAQAIAANSQRQIEIRRDTMKMAQLAQDLNEYLQKTQQGVMSIDAIKKAEQIEKLAHSVKSKMRQSF